MPLAHPVNEVRKRVFRVQTSWNGLVRVGTAFMIARLAPSRRIIVATAKHVLDFPADARVDWRFECFAEDGTVIGECRFATDESNEAARPHRSYKLADIGFCVLPPPEQTSEGQLVQDDLEPLRTIPETDGVLQGTRVGWVGFPGQVEGFLRCPKLCYFEGVVSAFHRVGGRWKYIVDGHNAPGVSGGPMWCWPADGTEVVVAGIVSGYGQDHQGMPGFCFFEAINPIIAYVKSQLQPYGNDPGLSERCRSFLKWASWSAHELSDDRWSVTGEVDWDYLAGFYLDDNDALAEIRRGNGEGTWWIDPDDGDLVSVSGLVGCDHR